MKHLSPAHPTWHSRCHTTCFSSTIIFIVIIYVTKAAQDFRYSSHSHDSSVNHASNTMASELKVRATRRSRALQFSRDATCTVLLLIWLQSTSRGTLAWRQRHEYTDCAHLKTLLLVIINVHEDISELVATFDPARPMCHLEQALRICMLLNTLEVKAVDSSHFTWSVPTKLQSLPMLFGSPYRNQINEWEGWDYNVFCAIASYDFFFTHVCLTKQSPHLCRMSKSAYN